MLKRITISVNGAESQIESASELLDRMAEAASMKYLEVWVEKGTEATCMLANGSLAWLMYLLNQDEECFSTRNPKVGEDTDEYLDFYLSNGQRDVYPVSYLITKEEAIRGIAEIGNRGQIYLLLIRDRCAISSACHAWAD